MLHLLHLHRHLLPSVSQSLSPPAERVRRSEEEEAGDDERQELRAELRAAERHLVQRAQLHRAHRGHPGAVCSIRLDRHRLGRGCVPARGAAASCLGRPNGE